MGRVAVQFTPDLEAPLMHKSLPDGIRILAMGEVVVLTGSPTSPGAERQFFPMAVEFDLGKGKVIYTSFTADPNLSTAASREIAFADGVSLTAEEVESWATVTTGWRERRGTTSTSGFGAVHNP